MYKCYKTSGKSHPAKDTCLRNFSIFIRLRDAIKTTNTFDYARCVTCGEIFPTSGMDAGHGIPGRKNAVLLDEELVFAQCRYCNRGKGGETQAFKKYLVDLHGEAWYDEKEDGKSSYKKYTDDDYRAMNEGYLAKIKIMKLTHRYG